MPLDGYDLLFLISLGFSAISALLVLFFVMSVTRSLRRIAKAMESGAKGTFFSDLPTSKGE